VTLRDAQGRLLRDAQGRLLHDAQGKPARGLVIAAHGSRRCRDANALVRRIAETLRARRLYDEVAVAFHQGEPGFDSVLDELTSDEATVVPFFTSEGHYTDVILPEALSRNRRHAELRLRQTPPVGSHAGIGALVARRATKRCGDGALPARCSRRFWTTIHRWKRCSRQRPSRT
jgi:sirohydrochlorin ferrochelatase